MSADTTEAVGFRIIVDKPNRFYAVDANDVEICGARQPFGHNDWVIYPTVRLTTRMHQVLALTREAAVEHVRMLAELYVRAHS